MLASVPHREYSVPCQFERRPALVFAGALAFALAPAGAQILPVPSRWIIESPVYSIDRATALPEISMSPPIFSKNVSFSEVELCRCHESAVRH